MGSRRDRALQTNYPRNSIPISVKFSRPGTENARAETGGR
ncbi:hypothetical protein thalar_03110 [Litoreibacter arenae DSM 19593]|uniref:Uncharacterized protein n=1 Tax=Litoreibacter arenae DSM 19593 TaxID=1123360 RepID=S9QBP5_9RHOB|nr:hypothetical protein thalar_03110 [Litoreibacter arenae DSM 19593]